MANTWLIGHSIGAQLIGIVAQRLSKLNQQQIGKVIGMDPAAPLFATKTANGKCNGIQRGYANQTIVFYTNPGGLGTENLALGDVNVLCNKKHKFCQHGCKCNDSICNHSYAVSTLLRVLIQAKSLKANHWNDDKMEPKHVSIYKEMMFGLYDLDAYENDELQNSSDKHTRDEL